MTQVDSLGLPLYNSVMGSLSLWERSTSQSRGSDKDLNLTQDIRKKVRRNHPKKRIIRKQLGSAMVKKLKVPFQWKQNTRTVQICFHHKTGNLSWNRQIMSSQTQKIMWTTSTEVVVRQDTLKQRGKQLKQHPENINPCFRDGSALHNF